MSLDNTPGTDMSLAILILTKEGLQVAERLKGGLPQADLYVAEGVEQRSSGRVVPEADPPQADLLGLRAE